MLRSKKDDRPIAGAYDFDELALRVTPLWNKIISIPMHAVYKGSPKARLVFNQFVGDIVTKTRQVNINVSFSRRLAFTTYKYGLAYHILADKTNDIIGSQDLTQAAKLVAVPLLSLQKTLGLYDSVPKSYTGNAQASPRELRLLPLLRHRKMPLSKAH